MLEIHGRRYIAVEADIDAVKAARAEGYPILFGDVSRPELIDRLRLGHADALVLTMDDPVLGIRLTRRVRGWVPGLTIIARARDTAHAAQLYRAGATDAAENCPPTEQALPRSSFAVSKSIAIVFTMGHAQMVQWLRSANLEPPYR
eukprot:gene16236-biopygen13833